MEPGQRIDRWLFFARVVKSRSLAAKLVQSGRVRRNRDKAQQASDTVRVGDVLTITLDRRILVYRVVDPGGRRGPAEEARLLYEDLSPEASTIMSPPRSPLCASSAQTGRGSASAAAERDRSWTCRIARVGTTLPKRRVARNGRA